MFRLARPPHPARAGICAAALLGLFTPAHAQLEAGWTPGFGLAGVVGDTYGPGVHELCVWNGDLYVSGEFQTAGSVAALSIARWDGQQFHALPEGLDAAARGTEYTEMIVHDDALVVAGKIVGPSGGDRIARWDGAAWTRLGEEFDHTIRALGVHGGALLAGGSFSSSGGTPVGHLARWTVSAWVPFADVEGGGVYAIGHYGSDLVIGGSFSAVDGVPCNNIARFDGTSWHPLGAGVGEAYESVRCLEEWGGELYAGGTFSTAGGVPAPGVARWDGSGWSDVGDSPYVSYLTELIADGPRLWALGSHVAGLDVHVASWDGTAWTGVDPQPDDLVRGGALYQGDLVVGGDFDRAGTTTLRNLGTWTGTEWTAFGEDRGTTGPVWAIEEYQDDVIVGGYFSGAGGQMVENICAWNGVEFLPVGAGLDGAVTALTTWNGLLVAGGWFQSSGGQGPPLVRVATWDGASWLPLGDGLPTGGVAKLLVHDGMLLAGGSFTLGPEASRIARWNGTEWEPFTFGPGGPVRSLVEFGGELHAGGDFAFAGQALASHVAAWTGNHWRTLGRGRQFPIIGLHVHDGDLISVGVSRYAPWENGPSPVGRWSGDAWVPFTEPYPLQRAYSATTYRGELVVGGGRSSNAVHRLAGDQWVDLDGAVSGDEVYVMKEIDGSLWIGGSVISAGSWASHGLARHRTLLPRTAAEPAKDRGSESRPETRFAIPTPFRPGSSLLVEGGSAAAGLSVFDVRGRRVRELHAASERAGETTYRWDGRTQDGSEAATGMYFVRLHGDGGETGKLLLIR